MAAPLLVSSCQAWNRTWHSFYLILKFWQMYKHKRTMVSFCSSISFWMTNLCKLILVFMRHRIQSRTLSKIFSFTFNKPFMDTPTRTVCPYKFKRKKSSLHYLREVKCTGTHYTDFFMRKKLLCFLLRNNIDQTFIILILRKLTLNLNKNVSGKRKQL